jgi:RNA polymerase sigma-70 factor, ECF subfamily
MLGPAEDVVPATTSGPRLNDGSRKEKELSGARVVLLIPILFFPLICVAGRCAVIQAGKIIVTSPLEEHLCTLLGAVASGDRKAFRTLYDKSAPVLFAICVRLMRDRDLAQDVFQEAMTRIWRKAHLFDASKGNALAWMAVVTRNCALSYRAAVPLPSPSLEEAGAQTAVEARPSGDQVITSDLRQCLKKLNDKYRKCVTLIYLHGLSYAELATHMDAPLGSVKSWVHRAVRELALCMGNDVRGS